MTRLASLFAALALAIGALGPNAAPTLAVSPGGSCLFGNKSYSWAINEVPQGSGYPINGAIAYVVAEPDPDIYWTPCSADSLFSGHMLLVDTIEGSSSGQIVQLGICSGNCNTPYDRTPHFWYTYNDSNSGYGVKPSWFPDPVTGHRYMLEVYNYHPSGQGYQWWYCLNDLTAGSGTLCGHTSASWTGGNLYWAGGETYNTNSIMGSFGNASIFELYAFDTRRTNSSSWAYQDPPCYVISAASYYRCTPTSWNGWHAAYYWTDPFGAPMPADPSATPPPPGAGTNSPRTQDVAP